MALTLPSAAPTQSTRVRRAGPKALRREHRAGLAAVPAGAHPRTAAGRGSSRELAARHKGSKKAAQRETGRVHALLSNPGS